MVDILTRLLEASREFWLGMGATAMLVVVLIIRGDLVTRKSVQSSQDFLESVLQEMNALKSPQEVLGSIVVAVETLNKIMETLPSYIPTADEDHE